MAEYDLEKLSPPERYHLLTRVVGPRPIAFVSTLNAEGRGNLAPFSYFNMGGANPASAIICPVKDRSSNIKDTLRNISETGEYVISVVTSDMGERMNQASWAYPHGIDEFDKVGFSRADSRVVKPPRVAESPVSLEMKLFQIVEHGDGPLSSNYIIGQIVHAFIDDAVLTNELPDNTKLELLGRLGGSWYTKVSRNSLFKMDRPSGPRSSSSNAG